MVKVTVIIPIYNAEKYIEKCLQSIANQSLRDMQVILVNDGSTDKTEEIIDEYVKKYSDIFEKVNKKNGGQASARNNGIEKALR